MSHPSARQFALAMGREHKSARRWLFGAASIIIILLAALGLRHVSWNVLAFLPFGAIATLAVAGAWLRRGRQVHTASCCQVIVTDKGTSSRRFCAKQVFDVQWSFSGPAGAQLVGVSGLRSPAGTTPNGRLMRAVVEPDDYFTLVPSDSGRNQFSLLHFGKTGSLKKRLTSFGHVKAISSHIILYMGDGQYGTLISLLQEYGPEFSGTFSEIVTSPPQELVLDAIQARGPVDPLEQPRGKHLQVQPPRRLSDWDREVSYARIASGVTITSTAGVSFNTRVFCVQVRDLTELNLGRKADLWWQPDDFHEFLQVRVQIGKAYRQAAKMLGVDVLHVSSVGSHAVAGHEEMIKEWPELTHESRRGLGLGRKRQRAKNRDAYIAAVLKEQKRLWELDVDYPEEALARVAAKYSEKDRSYAHLLAQSYYEADRAPGSADGKDDVPTLAFASLFSRVPSFSEEDSLALNAENNSLIILDDQAEQTEPLSPAAIERKSTKGQASKGFGLSRDTLKTAGLSVTGHSLSRRQRLGAAASADDDGGVESGAESDVNSGAESGDDC
mmetsp:Transcript_100562/g.181523  ORF Transcript_100562/g.181523 Transcript_100562/m.181523 type:complete len:555 (-) Transcript_100562:64-1728(-)